MATRYIEPDLDDLIAEALDFYAEHSDQPRERRTRALDYAFALRNDTWLIETAVPPLVHNCFAEDAERMVGG